MKAPHPRLVRLAVTRFRNYGELTWNPGDRLVVLHGGNGTGKTNLLEAISLISPGRGLRGARVAELAKRGAEPPSWAVAGRFETAQGVVEIATGSRPDGAADRRVFRLDGASPRSQAEIAARVPVVWLTPQMDRLFQEGAGGRRRFLDRLVFALEPGHAREVAALETALAGRRRLLAGPADPAWLDALEDSVARHAVSVTAARLALVRRLGAALRDGAASPFPAPRIALVDVVADRLAQRPALEVEDWLRGVLAASRLADAASGTGNGGAGAHRADFVLRDAAGLQAAQASTGQQKAMLIGLVLGHASLIGQARRAAPLLLLDEPLVHLDEARRTALFAALAASPAQALLTGTDAAPFAPLIGGAGFWRVADGALRPGAA